MASAAGVVQFALCKQCCRPSHPHWACPFVHIDPLSADFKPKSTQFHLLKRFVESHRSDNRAFRLCHRGPGIGASCDAEKCPDLHVDRVVEQSGFHRQLIYRGQPLDSTTPFPRKILKRSLCLSSSSEEREEVEEKNHRHCRRDPTVPSSLPHAPKTDDCAFPLIFAASVAPQLEPTSAAPFSPSMTNAPATTSESFDLESEYEESDEEFDNFPSPPDPPIPVTNKIIPPLESTNRRQSSTSLPQSAVRYYRSLFLGALENLEFEKQRNNNYRQQLHDLRCREAQSMMPQESDDLLTKEQSELSVIFHQWDEILRSIQTRLSEARAENELMREKLISELLPTMNPPNQ